MHAQTQQQLCQKLHILNKWTFWHARCAQTHAHRCKAMCKNVRACLCVRADCRKIRNRPIFVNVKIYKFHILLIVFLLRASARVRVREYIRACECVFELVLSQHNNFHLKKFEERTSNMRR